MKLDGSIRVTRPPHELIALLADPAVLRQIAPRGCEVGDKTGDAVAFTIQRKLGPITLKLPGHLSLGRGPDGAYHMTVEASHILGGGAKVDLTLSGSKGPAGHALLRWDGLVNSHGLAARVLTEKRDAAAQLVRNLFLRLRDVAEAGKPGPAGS